MNKLYTFGYSGSRASELLLFVDALGALVMDIRFSPHSKMPEWGGAAIRDFLGDGNYAHVLSLGNRNYLDGGGIVLDNPKLGVALVGTALGLRPVILLCGCRDVRWCHRKTAAQLVADEFGVVVEHLPARFAAWPGRLPRPVFGEANPRDYEHPRGRDCLHHV